MQLLNGGGMSAIITSVAFATVTDYAHIWIIQVVQTFLLNQNFSFKCLLTHEMTFRNFKIPKCTLPHTHNIEQKLTDTWNKYFDTYEVKNTETQ